MIPERWKAVETIVATALELSGEDQKSYLAAAETHARWLADRGWRWPEWVLKG